ncbi:MAG: ABC transporter permease [Candidatus Cloacimonetes bacterium]|nr:ABC transporter permease [Candidatus Cloacimonadota bacterium]MCF7813328.1 ABC transporter permease [Candidatus Cloacimonadota bacterium]MCF7867817.1 ABC transporter permease [Candidatus Cloacimonadota bacterium]MCF7883297.1 ABC transporter permease [Candidatus Cloacimonadota bacterium]
MFKNYLKIIIKTLKKHKAYSLISISSLAIGIAVSILLFLYVIQELSYDRYHEKADTIYRLCQEEHPYQAPGAGKLLADNLPEIKQYARILPRDDILVQLNDQKFKEDLVAWTDAEFFDIFSFEAIEGNVQNSLKEPGTAVINEKIAQKYFGDENAIGKKFIVKSEYVYTVVGVIKNIPQNSHFTFDIFLTLADGDKMFGNDWMDSWGWWNFLLYFEMHDQFSKPDLEAKISTLMKEVSNSDDDPVKFTLQNLKNIHLYSSHFLGDIQPQNSITYVLIFSAIGLLILLIACFNFVNLFIANATTRVLEMGIRKSFGASHKQIAEQYIVESMIVFLISSAIALIIVELSLPIFNEISGKILSFTDLLNPSMILSFLGSIIVLGILTGLYPALVLSSHNPSSVIKSAKSQGRSGFKMKKILLGAQFTIVIALIACAAIMLRQISFLQNKELGFEKEAVITSIFDFGDEAKYNTLKQALIKQSFVENVSTANRIPSGSLNNYGAVLPEGQTEGIAIAYVHVNFDYFRTLGIKPLQGRLFSEDFKTDTNEAIILNKAAVSLLGLKDNPIGHSIRCNWPPSTRKVVGIIDDINFEPLQNKVKPVVYVIDYSEAYHIIVKLKSSDIFGSTKAVTEITQSIYPEQVINFEFLDQILESRYQKDNKTFQLMGLFAFMAILLACFGLLGMTSFMLVRRTKEIAIRKVNGASILELIRLLNFDFVKLIVGTFVIAIPIAYYVMSKWLNSFAYKVELSWWIFALSGLIALLIALVTVSFLTYNAARRNPVLSLKCE